MSTHELRITLEQLAAATAPYHRDILLVLGPHATIAHQNGEAERLFGRTSAQLDHAPLLDFVHPDDVRSLCVRLDHLVPHPIVTLPPMIEVRLRRADGQWSWFHCSLLDRRADPGISGIVFVGRDITERKIMELRLRDSEARFDTVLWGAHIAYWDWDVAARWATHSDQWFAITGWDPKDWYADVQPWSKRVHPEDHERVEARIKDHLEGRTPLLELEYRMRCADGSWRWMLDRGRVVAWNAAGHAIRVTGTSMDIDARKRAEEALRQSELRYRTVGEFAEGFIQEFELDRTGQTTLRWVSEGFQRIIGLSLEEARLLGGWQVFLPPEERIPESFWISLRYLNFYRIALATVFLGTAAFYEDALNLVAYNIELFRYLAGGYLFCGVLLHGVLRDLRDKFELQLSLHVGVDIVAITLLMYASGGMKSGLGVMLLISLTGAAIVAPRRLTFAYAALATIALLLEQVYWVLEHDAPTAAFVQPGLLAIGCFATGGVTSWLAARVAANERLARQRGRELATQTRVNQLVIEDMHDGVLVLDRGGRVVQHNPQAQQLLGTASLLGARIDHLVPGFPALTDVEVAGRDIRLRPLESRAEEFSVLLVEDTSRARE